MKRSRKTIEQLEELVLKRNVDVTMQHTNGHALDTYHASNPRENDRNAKSMSPGTTRATQGDHRWHKVPRLPRKNTPRVTTEGMRHIRGNASTSHLREISASQTRGFPPSTPVILVCFSSRSRPRSFNLIQVDVVKRGVSRWTLDQKVSQHKQNHPKTHLFFLEWKYRLP